MKRYYIYASTSQRPYSIIGYVEASCVDNRAFGGVGAMQRAQRAFGRTDVDIVDAGLAHACRSSPLVFTRVDSHAFAVAQ